MEEHWASSITLASDQRKEQPLLIIWWHLWEMKGNLLSRKDFLIMSQKTTALLVSFLRQPELHGLKIQLSPSSLRINTQLLENIVLCLTGSLSVEMEWQQALGAVIPLCIQGLWQESGWFWLWHPSVAPVIGTNTMMLRSTSCSLGRLNFVLGWTIGIQRRQLGVNTFFVPFGPKPQPPSSCLLLRAVSAIAGLHHSFNTVL